MTGPLILLLLTTRWTPPRMQRMKRTIHLNMGKIMPKRPCLYKSVQGASLFEAGEGNQKKNFTEAA